MLAKDAAFGALSRIRLKPLRLLKKKALLNNAAVHEIDPHALV
jgi:hypothetical protein